MSREHIARRSGPMYNAASRPTDKPNKWPHRHQRAGEDRDRVVCWPRGEKGFLRGKVRPRRASLFASFFNGRFTRQVGGGVGDAVAAAAGRLTCTLDFARMCYVDWAGPLPLYMPPANGRGIFLDCFFAHSRCSRYTHSRVLCALSLREGFNFARLLRLGSFH